MNMAPPRYSGWKDGGRYGAQQPSAPQRPPAARGQGKVDPALRGHAGRKPGPDANASNLDRLRVDMAAAKLDAVAITHLPNVYYLCGFTGSNALLMVLPDAAHLFTDGRYTIQAHEECPAVKVHISKKPLAEDCAALLRSQAKRARARSRVGYEAAHLTVAEWDRMEAAAGKSATWKPASGMVETLREVKSPAELDVMREAARLGSEVMAEAIGLAREGISELDLAAEIDFRMRRKGASGPSFDTIVAAGVRSALPHAHPTAKALQKNELVVLDLGVILRHYCSDLTRTIYVGKAPADVRRWYNAVEQAQQAALEAVRPGVTAGEIDRAARRVLEKQGLGQYFVHSTGHGLGIEIHETPRVGRKQKQVLREGMVITLEPGVYVEGAGGIRIEDDIVVQDGRAEVLTSAPRGLIEL